MESQIRQKPKQQQSKHSIADLHREMLRNEAAQKKRAEQLFRKVEYLMRDNTQLYLQQNLSLQAALKYIAEQEQNTRNSTFHLKQQEQQLDQQIFEEACKQNQILLQQIEIINNQIKQLNNKKTNYQLLQNETLQKILCHKQQILQNKLLANLVKKDDILNNPCLYFALDEKPDGSLRFKESYLRLIDHYTRRLSDNTNIINKMQRNIKQIVSQIQHSRFRLDTHKRMQEQHKQIEQDIVKMKQKIQKQRQQLVNLVRQKNQEIDEKVSIQFDNSIIKLIQRNNKYKCAYHQMLELFKKVTDDADIGKVSQNIKFQQNYN